MFGVKEVSQAALIDAQRSALSAHRLQALQVIALDRRESRHAAHQRPGAERAGGIAAVRIPLADTHHQAYAFIDDEVGAVALQVGRTSVGRIHCPAVRLADLKQRAGRAGRYARVLAVGGAARRVAGLDAEVRTAAESRSGEAGHRFSRCRRPALIFRRRRITGEGLSVELIMSRPAGRCQRDRAGDQPQSDDVPGAARSSHGCSRSTIARMKDAFGPAGARARYSR